MVVKYNRTYTDERKTDMKKLVAILIVLCLIFVGSVGCANVGEAPAEAPEESPEVQPSEEPTGADADSETPAAAAELDFEAIYALHEPEELVLTVGGRDVTWAEYFYMFFTQASQVQDYFSAMSMYYGASFDWSDTMGEDSGTTYAQYVLTSTEQAICQLQAIRAFAAENNIELTEEDLANIAADDEANLVGFCGEGATEEDFDEYLAGIYLNRELYDEINRVNYLYQRCYKELYGENSELFDEAEALKYLEDNGYISANHILLMTKDASTGEALDEAAAAEKQAQAEEIAQELQGIENHEELLARFAELKEQYCEDTGKVNYPDGYVFTPGTMVAEFEDTCNALEEYQVSDPVKSDYGYHIIIRLPADADRVMQYSSDGTAMSARAVAANTEYGERMQECYEGLEHSFAEGFNPPAIGDYLK